MTTRLKIDKVYRQWQKEKNQAWAGKQSSEPAQSKPDESSQPTCQWQTKTEIQSENVSVNPQKSPPPSTAFSEKHRFRRQHKK